MNFITLTEENIGSEHICCAISDKKCRDGYELKKEWLRQQIKNGYVFYRLDERGKVFIEYGPAEMAWAPIKAENYTNINCFWVSGKYKGTGLGKTLLGQAQEDALKQERAGLVTVVGKKKYHFMSDGKWLSRQGFEQVDETASGFALLARKFHSTAPDPVFSPHAKTGECPHREGLTVYYSNRCPFTEFHVNTSLKETAEKRNLPLKVIKIDTLEEARRCPSPATIFSLFFEGQFLTTDLSVCLEKRFDKFLEKRNLL